MAVAPAGTPVLEYDGECTCAALEMFVYPLLFERVVSQSGCWASIELMRARVSGPVQPVAVRPCAVWKCKRPHSFGCKCNALAHRCEREFTPAAVPRDR
jgi:hypothetical protein